MTRLIHLLVFMFIMSTVHAQMVTDRPDQTESATTVGPNFFQLESGVAFHVSPDRYEWDFLSNLFRFGIGHRFELRLVNSLHYFEPRSENLKGKTGIGDFEIGAKYNIIDKTVKMGLLGHLILPTANEPFSNGNYGLMSRIAISHPLGNRAGIGYNLGYDHDGSGSGDLTFTTALGFDLTEKLGFFTEIYGRWVNFQEVGLHYDNGFTYLINDNLQFDFAFGTSFTGDTNFYGVGISWKTN